MFSSVFSPVINRMSQALKRDGRIDIVEAFAPGVKILQRPSARESASDNLKLEDGLTGTSPDLVTAVFTKFTDALYGIRDVNNDFEIQQEIDYHAPKDLTDCLEIFDKDKV